MRDRLGGWRGREGTAHTLIGQPGERGPDRAGHRPDDLSSGRAWLSPLPEMFGLSPPLPPNACTHNSCGRPAPQCRGASQDAGANQPSVVTMDIVELPPAVGWPS